MVVSRCLLEACGASLRKFPHAVESGLPPASLLQNLATGVRREGALTCNICC